MRRKEMLKKKLERTQQKEKRKQLEMKKARI